MHRRHAEAPYHAQGQNDQYDICCNIEASIGKIEFLLIDCVDWLHGFIPTRVDRVGEEDIEEEGGSHIHAIEADHEPAHCVKPSLDENAAVEEDEGNTGRGIGECVEDVGSVAGLGIMYIDQSKDEKDGDVEHELCYNELAGRGRARSSGARTQISLLTRSIYNSSQSKGATTHRRHKSRPCSQPSISVAERSARSTISFNTNRLVAYCREDEDIVVTQPRNFGYLSTPEPQDDCSH